MTKPVIELLASHLAQHNRFAKTWPATVLVPQKVFALASMEINGRPDGTMFSIMGTPFYPHDKEQIVFTEDATCQ